MHDLVSYLTGWSPSSEKELSMTACLQNGNEEVRNRLRIMSQEAAQKEAWLEDQQEQHARRERSVSLLQGPLGPMAGLVSQVFWC